MLVRHPQPADLDKGGKFWTRVQSSPTPECTRINLLNQVPQTHALGGIQTWLATGPRTAAMHCHKLPNPYAPTGFRAEDREGRPDSRVHDCAACPGPRPSNDNRCRRRSIGRSFAPNRLDERKVGTRFVLCSLR